jgi:polar amino acid transport system substrate-binding protein
MASFHSGHRRVPAVPFILIMCAACVLPAAAESQYPPDIQRIKDRGEFIVVMTAADQPPFYYINGEGKLAGLDVDIATAIASSLGVKASFNREAKSFGDLIPLITSGKADAAISKLSRTTARAQMVAFSNPYITFRQALILNRLEVARKAPTNDDIVGFVKDLTGKIGVIADSSYVNYARKNFPHATVVTYASWDKVVDAVFSGEILAGYRDEMEIKKIIRSRPDASLKAKTAVLKDTQDNIAIAVAWQNTHLLSYINLVLEGLNLDLTADSLLDSYADIFSSKQ